MVVAYEVYAQSSIKKDVIAQRNRIIKQMTKKMILEIAEECIEEASASDESAPLEVEVSIVKSMRESQLSRQQDQQNSQEEDAAPEPLNITCLTPKLTGDQAITHNDFERIEVDLHQSYPEVPEVYKAPTPSSQPYHPTLESDDSSDDGAKNLEAETLCESILEEVIAQSVDHSIETHTIVSSILQTQIIEPAGEALVRNQELRYEREVVEELTCLIQNFVVRETVEDQIISISKQQVASQIKVLSPYKRSFQKIPDLAKDIQKAVGTTEIALREGEKLSARNSSKEVKKPVLANYLTKRQEDLGLDNTPKMRARDILDEADTPVRFRPEAKPQRIQQQINTANKIQENSQEEVLTPTSTLYPNVEARNMIHKSPSKISIDEIDKYSQSPSLQYNKIGEDNSRIIGTDCIFDSSFDQMVTTFNQMGGPDKLLTQDKVAQQICDSLIDEFYIKQMNSHIIRESVIQINEEYQTNQAIKIVQKRMIKSVTKKFITDIIQESTDAIYQFEDDSISTADYILKDVLKIEIRKVIDEVVRDGLLLNSVRGSLAGRESVQSAADFFEIPSEYDQDYYERTNSRKSSFIYNEQLARQRYLEEQDISMNQSMMSGSMADDESQSRVIHSRGMDPLRKSIIQQHSERYLMKKSINPNQKAKQDIRKLYMQPNTRAVVPKENEFDLFKSPKSALKNYQNNGKKFLQKDTGVNELIQVPQSQLRALPHKQQPQSQAGQIDKKTKYSNPRPQPQSSVFKQQMQMLQSKQTASIQPKNMHPNQIKSYHVQTNSTAKLSLATQSYSSPTRAKYNQHIQQQDHDWNEPEPIHEEKISYTASRNAVSNIKHISSLNPVVMQGGSQISLHDASSGQNHLQMPSYEGSRTSKNKRSLNISQQLSERMKKKGQNNAFVESVKAQAIQLSSEDDMDESVPSIINSDQEFSLSPSGFNRITERRMLAIQKQSNQQQQQSRESAQQNKLVVSQSHNQVYVKQGLDTGDDMRGQKAPTPVMQNFLTNQCMPQEAYNSQQQSKYGSSEYLSLTNRKQRLGFSNIKSKGNIDLENISRGDSSNDDSDNFLKEKHQRYQQSKGPIVVQSSQPVPKDKIRKSTQTTQGKLSKKMKFEQSKFQSKVIQISLEDLKKVPPSPFSGGIKTVRPLVLPPSERKDQ